MPRPLVSIIVPTLNTPRLTRACLTSVAQNTTVPYELIVVNNSRAKEIRRTLREFPRVRVIQNARNLGYTKAANQGARASRGRFLCFLNTDTLVPPRWMERLLDAAEHPRVGAVGPTSQGYIRRQQWMRRSPWERRALTILTDEGRQRWHRDRPLKPVTWVPGFCCLIPQPVMDRVGPFDERFFFGWEDSDYSLRLRLEGFRLLQVTTLFVYHQNGGSAPRSRILHLVRQAGERFLAKWSVLLGRRFTDPRQVYEEVARRVERSRGTRSGGRFRTAFISSEIPRSRARPTAI